MFCCLCCIYIYIHAFNRRYNPKQITIEEHEQFITEPAIFIEYSARFIRKID